MTKPDNYTFLLDILALDKVIKRYLDATNEEEKRMEFLLKQKHNRAEQGDELQANKREFKTQLTDLEKELFEVDSKLESSTKHESNISDQKQLDLIKAEMENLQTRKDSLENDILTLYEKIENIDAQLTETQEFINGVTQTIEEISNEVDKIKEDNLVEVQKLEKQIRGLEGEIPESLKVTFSRARDKFRFNDPMVVVESPSCLKCRFQITPSEFEEIKNGALTNCKGCHRLVIYKSFT